MTQRIVRGPQGTLPRCLTTLPSWNSCSPAPPLPLDFIFRLVLILFFARLKLSKSNAKHPPLGEFLRRWLKSSLYFFVALSSLVGAAYIANLFFFPGEQIYKALPWLAFLAPLDVFTIYAGSSMRLLGFLPSTVGPLRLGLRIAADVVFYIVPAEGSKLAMAARAQRRFRELIVGLSRQFKDRILVIAYSQGSVIAANALPVTESAQTNFITAGSPIETLYGRFLGIEDRLKLPTWKNFYRLAILSAAPLATRSIRLWPITSSSIT